MRCCAKHDRIYSMILNGASLPENYCIGYAYVDKHISTRCLEVIETVANQRIFVWSPPFKDIYRNCGSGAASNPVVHHHVVLSETPDRDPCAIRAKAVSSGGDMVTSLSTTMGPSMGQSANWLNTPMPCACDHPQ